MQNTHPSNKLHGLKGPQNLSSPILSNYLFLLSLIHPSTPLSLSPFAFCNNRKFKIQIFFFFFFFGVGEKSFQVSMVYSESTFDIISPSTTVQIVGRLESSSHSYWLLVVDGCNLNSRLSYIVRLSVTMYNI